MALLLTDAEQITLDKYYMLETNSSDECEEEDKKLAEEHQVPTAAATGRDPGPSGESAASPNTERELIYRTVDWPADSDSDSDDCIKFPPWKRRILLPADD